MSRISFTSSFMPLTTSDITRLPAQASQATVAQPTPPASVNVKTYEVYEEPKNSHGFLKTILLLGALAGGIVALKRFNVIKPIAKTEDMKFIDKAKNGVLKLAEWIEYPFVKLANHFKTDKVKKGAATPPPETPKA